MKVNVKYGQRSRHRPRPRGPGLPPQPHRAGLSQGPGHAAHDATWSHTWSDLTCIPDTCQTRSCSTVQHYIHLHALDPNQRRIHDLGLLVGLKLEMLSLSIVNRQSRSHLEWIGLKSTGKIIISSTEASGLCFWIVYRPSVLSSIDVENIDRAK